MKKSILVIYLLISFFVLIGSGVSCDGEIPVTTTPVTTTAFYEGFLHMHITMSMDSNLIAGSSISKVNVFSDTMPKSGEVKLQGKTIFTYNQGDQCFKVVGNIENGTEQNIYASISAVGYNSEMQPVSVPVFRAEITGYPDYRLPPKTISSFQIILTWADDVKLIEILAASDNTNEWIFHEP
jgi:hypothetical protein